MNDNNLEERVKDWRLDSNIVLLYPKYKNLSDLEKDWDNFVIMNTDLQDDSDEKSMELFGKTNQDRYEIMLNDFYNDNSIDSNEFQFNKNKHEVDNDVDDLYFTINYDKDRYFYNRYLSASIQESMNSFVPSENYLSEIEAKIFNDNTDIIDESFTYPYYTPKEIEYYDNQFKNIKLPIKESMFITRWKKAYTEGFETGDFSKLRSLNMQWKDKIEEIADSDLNKDIKKKALLNLGCNYALPVSKENLDNLGNRVKNSISDIYKNIRIYTVNDIGESVVNNYTYDKSFYYDFIRKFNLWIIVNKSTDKIVFSFDKSVPLYTDGINNKDQVIIYCGRIPKKPNEYANKIFPSNAEIKYALSSIIDSFNTQISLFKIFEGDYDKFSEDCLGLYVLYMVSRYNINNTIKANESTNIFIEAKTTNEFPVEFNKDGDLLISKGRKIDFEGEYSRTHLALKIYEKNSNIVGMKYCICKLWYLNIKLEEKIHDKSTSIEDKKKSEKARSKIVNDITKYSQIVLKKDPNFDIIKTYQNSPFNDDKIRIPTSTIDHTIEWIKRLLKFKKGF